MSEPNPVDLANFIQAVLDIGKDPKTWDARVSEMREHAATAAMANDEANTALQAAVDHRTAAETALANAAEKEASVERWSGQVDAKVKTLADREGKVTDREAGAKQREDNAKFREDQLAVTANNLDHRHADLVEREEALAAERDRVNALLADYDEAKHKAALKLAS